MAARLSSLQVLDVDTLRPVLRRWSTGWRLVLVLGLLAVVTHLPSLVRTEVLNPDESFLATQAQVINHGGRLYHDVVDRKPPIVPYVYALTFRVTGSDSLWWVRVVAIGAHLLTALLVAAIARERWNRRAGLAAGIFYLTASCGLVVEDSQPANFEVFMTTLMCAAMYLGLRERTAPSGTFAALATLAKQTAATTMLPLAWLAWRRDRLSGVIRLGAAFAGLIAAVAVLFGWRDFVFWVFTGTTGYLDASGSWSLVVKRGFASSGIFLGANVAALLLVIAGARRWRQDIELWLWLLAGIIGVAAGFRFFGHYYLQIAPPFALLAAGTIADSRLVVWLRSAALSGLSILVFVALAFVTHPRILHRYDRITAAIDASTRPGERIFVWGQFPQLYWASGRQPATRFLTSGFLTNFSGGRSPSHIGPEYAVDGAWDDFSADLGAHPPALIIDASAGTPFAVDRFPAFAAYIDRDYVPLGQMDGVLFYTRRDRP